MPFMPSEQLVYEGEFSKLLLRGINIAELRFKAYRPAAVAGAQASGDAQQASGDAQAATPARPLMLNPSVWSAANAAHAAPPARPRR